jgi:hypothetical protein
MLIDASAIQLTADWSNVHTPTRQTPESATVLSAIGLVIELPPYGDDRETKSNNIEINLEKSDSEKTEIIYIYIKSGFPVTGNRWL